MVQLLARRLQRAGKLSLSMDEKIGRTSKIGNYHRCRGIKPTIGVGVEGGSALVYDRQMSLSITVPDIPSESDHDAVLAPLRAYNVGRAGDPRVRPVAALLTDCQGTAVGGLWGKCVYDWLVVELLAVPEEHRGNNYGTALMERAERIARANGCIGIWLDTFEFQARGFYEKLGFEVFGTLDDHPAGQQCFFLRKRLEPAPRDDGNLVNAAER